MAYQLSAGAFGAAWMTLIAHVLWLAAMVVGISMETAGWQGGVGSAE